MDSPYAGPWKATVLRISDGDTFLFEVKLPFFVTHRYVKVRLDKVSCDESKTERGKLATAFVKQAMPEGTEVTITTRLVRTIDPKEELYARYAADVTLGNGEDLGQALLDAGLAQTGSHKGWI